MKVILLQTINRLGKIGDVITVKEGYARNYLIPTKAAKEATAGNMKMLDALKKKHAAGEAKILAEANVLSEKLSALSLTITVEAGEEDKIFGSVSNDTIADALLIEGITIDKRDIALGETIKKLGVYLAVVKLHPEVKANLKVCVVKN